MLNILEEVLKDAGVIIDGPNPWDPKINYAKTTKRHLMDRILSGGSLAIGESFMEEEWDVEDLEEMLFRIMRRSRFDKLLRMGNVWYFLKTRLFNMQNIKRSWAVGEVHYNIGNDLYEKMLGKTMSYTSAYWKDAKDLDEAQIAKLDLICKKLNLQKGQKLLDVGCGWGNFMKYAAENYGVSCVGLTVSTEQTKLGMERCKGLPIEFWVGDYRTYDPGYKFDHIVSIEMIEAVGPKNLKTYFSKLSSLLKDEGLFLLQVITNTKTVKEVEPWINKYIFPNGHLPSLRDIANSIETRLFKPNYFIVEDIHSLGIDYSKTLMAWWNNFKNSYEELYKNNPKYDKKFYRMWKYYLLMSSAGERARAFLSWQLVLSKKGLEGGYNSYLR